MSTKKEMCRGIARRLLATFIYPLLIMTIRLEIEVIFNMRYEKFFANIGPSGNQYIDEGTDENGKTAENAHSKALRLINGVITEIIDPNLLYSRLSFLESGREAIDLKNDLNFGKKIGYQ